MAYFLVSYDLVKEQSSFDYQPLWDELDRLGGVKTLLSEYLLEADNTAQEVVNHLKQFIDSNDRLMAVEFIKRPAYTYALKGTNAWISERF